MGNTRKKVSKGILTALFLMLLLTVADICPAQAAVKLSDTSVNLCVRDKYQLRLTGTNKKVNWKSSKTSVAKVTSKGIVTARAKGTATITATVSKKNYKCRVRVNKTFKVDKTSVSVKRNTDVTAFLSASGGVNATVADKKICSVTFGKWDGDYIPATIVPKKVGSTTIKFTNTANGEYCTLTVKVTALPSVASFRTATISTGSDTLIVDESRLSVPFSLNRASSKTYFRVYDENGATVRSISLGSVKANIKKTAVWDGKDDDGNPLSGTFTYAIVADGNRTDAKKDVKVLAASPFGKGDGTEKNPYLVSDLDELYLIKNYNGAFFAQDADIDFNYGMNTKIFEESDPFVGTFDGKNYRMVNLVGYNSVFGSIGAAGSVKNVSMSNCVLNTVGSLLAYTNMGTIDNCSVNGRILCNAGNQAAMLVMYNKGVIRDCTTSGMVNIEMSNVIGPVTLYAGGIAFQNSGTIAKCTSSVQITQRIMVSSYVAGLVHEIYTGGIAAENTSGAIVTQCVFVGSVNSSVVLPEAVKDVLPEQACRFYSGFVAGTNNGNIVNCVNASSSGFLTAQGTGNGTVQ